MVSWVIKDWIYAQWLEDQVKYRKYQFYAATFMKRNFQE